MGWATLEAGGWFPALLAEGHPGGDCLGFELPPREAANTSVAFSAQQDSGGFTWGFLGKISTLLDTSLVGIRNRVGWSPKWKDHSGTSCWDLPRGCRQNFYSRSS